MHLEDLPDNLPEFRPGQLAFLTLRDNPRQSLTFSLGEFVRRP